jgi:hypothetical protein
MFTTAITSILTRNFPSVRAKFRAIVISLFSSISYALLRTTLPTTNLNACTGGKL